jgi:hypothetical protein
MAAVSGAGDVEARLEQWHCNICLDPACDPVTTLCGHLYCWPCIYQARRRRRDSLEILCTLPQPPLSHHLFVSRSAARAPSLLFCAVDGSACCGHMPSVQGGAVGGSGDSHLRAWPATDRPARRESRDCEHLRSTWRGRLTHTEPHGRCRTSRLATTAVASTAAEWHGRGRLPGQR